MSDEVRLLLFCIVALLATIGVLLSGVILYCRIDDWLFLRQFRSRKNQGKESIWDEYDSANDPENK